MIDKRKRLTKKNFIYIVLSLIAFILINIYNAFNVVNFTNFHNDDNKLSISYIDVGQGESILIKTPNGKVILIDAGGTKKDASYNYLKIQDISKIDIIFITHPHSDHISELSKIIEKFEVNEIYMPKVSHTSKTFENLIDTISSKKVKVKEAKAGLNINLDNEISCLIVAPNSSSYNNLNNWSCVIHLTYKNNSFLFTGDAEEVSENEILNNNFDIKSEVLKIGHHGSNTSTTDRFLDSVNPTYAIISCSIDNKYGHPHKEVVSRLLQRNIKIYSTAENGTITLVSDGDNIYFK